MSVIFVIVFSDIYVNIIQGILKLDSDVKSPGLVTSAVPITYGDRAAG